MENFDDFEEEGINVACDLHDLIERVYIAPGHDQEFRDSVEGLLASAGLDVPIEASELDIRAVTGANEVTTILEPGLSQFGSVDGVVVFRGECGNKAVLLIEAKRQPLCKEWNNHISKADDKWNSSHLVVQIARKIAFIQQLKACGSDAEICFQASKDYWSGALRRMSLKKASVLGLIRRYEFGKVPILTATFTAGNWLPQPSSGDKALNDVLGPWGLSDQGGPIHLDFRRCLAAGDKVFPLFCRTFSLCGWDTIYEGRDWREWRDHVKDQGAAGALEDLEHWAKEESLSWTHCHHRKSMEHNTLKRGRPLRAVARTRGSYGTSGPMLDLQIKHGVELRMPRGWNCWDPGVKLPEMPPAGNQWCHNFLVPEEPSVS
ncbi:unnamed protein product [Cladocopium goreaui]|uniref:Uncharacterized protein n=1 Tax=Cladocopium goreaui TaxID=2562237 RepID=A0A9P1FCL3_9DINO|nr:unnamed protein product [Cladocopium goreaui]